MPNNTWYGEFKRTKSSTSCQFPHTHMKDIYVFSFYVDSFRCNAEKLFIYGFFLPGQMFLLCCRKTAHASKHSRGNMKMEWKTRRKFRWLSEWVSVCVNQEEILWNRPIWTSTVHLLYDGGSCAHMNNFCCCCCCYYSPSFHNMFEYIFFIFRIPYQCNCDIWAGCVLFIVIFSFLFSFFCILCPAFLALFSHTLHYSICIFLRHFMYFLSNGIHRSC